MDPRHSKQLSERLASGQKKVRDGAIREVLTRLEALEKLLRKSDGRMKGLGRKNESLEAEVHGLLAEKAKLENMARKANRDFRVCAVLSEERWRSEGGVGISAAPWAESALLEQHGEWIAKNFMELGPWAFSKRVCRGRASPLELQELYIKAAVRMLDLSEASKEAIIANVEERPWEGSGKGIARMLVGRREITKRIYAWSRLLGGGAGWDEQTARKASYTVSPFAALAEGSGYTPFGHGWRVMLFGQLVADALSPKARTGNEAFERKWALARLGMLWHDIGKACAPNELMRKHPLHPDEREMLREHPSDGVRLLHGISGLAGVRGPAETEILQVVYDHHEKVSGSGYPHGKGAGAISVWARIASIADVLDAMTAGRTYKSPVPAAAAVAEIMRKAGCQFDKAMAETFVQAVGEDRKLRKRMVEIIGTHGIKPD